MRFGKDFLKNVLDLVDGISDWFRHVRVEGECEALNGLQRIADLIVHPLDSLEALQHLYLLGTCSKFPTVNKDKCQSGSQQASDETERTVPVHPVLEYEPLKKDGNGKHKNAGYQRGTTDPCDRRDLR